MSIPVDVTEDPEYAKLEEKGVKGRYVSVERLQELDNDKVEWRMATSSTPGGNIPQFVADSSMASTISRVRSKSGNHAKSQLTTQPDRMSRISWSGCTRTAPLSQTHPQSLLMCMQRHRRRQQLPMLPSPRRLGPVLPAQLREHLPVLGEYTLYTRWTLYTSSIEFHTSERRANSL